MRINCLSIAAFLSLSIPVFGQGLIEVLNDKGFTSFAADLQSYPNLLARITENNDVTVFAPTNEAFAAAHGDTGNNTKLRKRASESQNGEQAAHTGPPPPEGRKRQNGDLPDSNFVTLRTFLEDPAFVNLGPNQPGRIVQNNGAPPEGTEESILEVTSGLGDVSSQVNGSFKYDKGIIVGVNRYFTLPRPLIETLGLVGLAVFRDAIISAGLEQRLSDTPGVTIFAFNNTDSISVEEHTITGTFAYTPELFNRKSFTSDAGTALEITAADGDLFVNGVHIIKGNIIIKNGVVHQLEGPLSSATPSSTTSPESPSGTVSGVPTFTGSAMSNKPRDVILGVVFVAVCLMGI